MEAEKTLEHYFGYTQFRSKQKDVVESILGGHDTLAVLPTGTGKSVCFQVPGLMLKGITIVITPLIALMKDQVDGLKKRSIPAEYLASTQSSLEQEIIYKELASNKLKFIYISPERLHQKKFKENISKCLISLIVVDEAHCISQWGDYFRSEYKQISNFIGSLKKRPIIAALTATATQHVLNDIKISLNLINSNEHITTAVRDNLIINVLTCQNYFYQIILLIRIIKKHTLDCGIIYASTRTGVEDLYHLIKTWKILPCEKIAFYHGGLHSEKRNTIQKNFISNKYSLLIATNAFGMGIDKPDIRYVVHYHIPSSLTAYYQEIGRAGRDGSISNCYLLFNSDNILIQNSFINSIKNKYVQKNELHNFKSMLDFVKNKNCRNAFLQSYFSNVTSNKCEILCDICNDKNHTADKDLQNSVLKLLKIRAVLSKKHNRAPAEIISLQSITYIALLKPVLKEDYLNIPGIGIGWLKYFKEFQDWDNHLSPV